MRFAHLTRWWCFLDSCCEGFEARESSVVIQLGIIKHWVKFRSKMATQITEPWSDIFIPVKWNMLSCSEKPTSLKGVLISQFILTLKYLGNTNNAYANQSLLGRET